VSQYYNLGTRQGHQYFKYKIMQDGQQLSKRNSVTLPVTLTLPSPPTWALFAYLHSLSLYNSILPSQTRFQFQLHT